MECNEEWLKIAEFLGMYEISSKGRVRSINGILSGGINTGGYKHITLWKNGKPYMRRINRLVALYFIPNPDNLPIVMHLDDDKLNNSYTNLKWGTHQDNMDDMTNKGRQAKLKGSENNFSILIEEDIPDIYRRAWSGEKYRDIAKDYGVKAEAIGSIKRGVNWLHITKNL